MAKNNLKVFTGNANPKLAKEICKHLGIKLGLAEVAKFADSDTKVKLLETVRGKDVYIVQPTCRPTNEHLMELLIMVDACKRGAAEQVTAVVPWYGYARQDYMPGPRQPITAKLVANLIAVAGTDRIITLDLHAPSIQGFFDIPVERLSALALFCDYIKKLKLKNYIIVAPDAGGVKRAKKVADTLHVPLAIINKYRPKENVAAVHSVIGKVDGKDCIIVDDMVDTAGSVTEGAKILKKKGAKNIYVFAAHGVFSEPALKRIKKSGIKQVFVTDSLPRNEKNPKIKVISVAHVLAETIKRIHTKKSVSAPYKYAKTNISAFA